MQSNSITTIIYKQNIDIHVFLALFKFRKNSIAETEFFIETRVPSKLPILDIGMTDVGRVDQEFGITLGDVCFT